MTGYTVHTGSNVKFSGGWDQIFGGKKKAPAKAAAAKKAPAAKAAKKTAAKKKSAKKKSLPG